MITTAKAVENVVFISVKEKTNLGKKFAINSEIDKSISSRYVFHHAVLLQLKNAKWTTNEKQCFT